MKLVILITAQIENGLSIAQKWQIVGAPGVTVLRSHGLFGLQEKVSAGDFELPRMVASMSGALAHLLDSLEETGLMLISVMDDQDVDKAVAAAQEVMGDLRAPNNGVMFVLDVERAIGVRHHG